MIANIHGALFAGATLSILLTLSCLILAQA